METGPCFLCGWRGPHRCERCSEYVPGPERYHLCDACQRELFADKLEAYARTYRRRAEVLRARRLPEPEEKL